MLILVNTHKTLIPVTLILLLSVMLMSCENKIASVPKSELLNLPSLTAKDFKTVFNDSGKLQVIMYAPIVERYENKDQPYSEFKSGIRVVFHDGKKDSVASVTSKYAKYLNSKNTWELRDSVVVINENGDKLETELLNWNQGKDLIYTDRYVKISNEDQITHAYGFESDSHLNNRKLKKVTATIYLKDEQ